MGKPNPKDLFRGLDAKAAPKISPAEAPATNSNTSQTSAQRQRSRQGKKVVTYYLDPEPFCVYEPKSPHLKAKMKPGEN